MTTPPETIALSNGGGYLKRINGGYVDITDLRIEYPLKDTADFRSSHTAVIADARALIGKPPLGISPAASGSHLIAAEHIIEPLLRWYGVPEDTIDIFAHPSHRVTRVAPRLHIHISTNTFNASAALPSVNLEKWVSNLDPYAASAIIRRPPLTTTTPPVNEIWPPLHLLSSLLDYAWELPTPQPSVTHTLTAKIKMIENDLRQITEVTLPYRLALSDIGPVKLASLLADPHATLERERISATADIQLLLDAQLKTTVELSVQLEVAASRIKSLSTDLRSAQEACDDANDALYDATDSSFLANTSTKKKAAKHPMRASNTSAINKAFVCLNAPLTPVSNAPANTCTSISIYTLTTNTTVLEQYIFLVPGRSSNATTLGYTYRGYIQLRSDTIADDFIADVARQLSNSYLSQVAGVFRVDSFETFERDINGHFLSSMVSKEDQHGYSVRTKDTIVGMY